jgi:hypothetical protein
MPWCCGLAPPILSCGSSETAIDLAFRAARTPAFRSVASESTVAEDLFASGEGVAVACGRWSASWLLHLNAALDDLLATCLVRQSGAAGC